jgi:hypothetical protein
MRVSGVIVEIYLWVRFRRHRPLRESAIDPNGGYVTSNLKWGTDDEGNQIATRREDKVADTPYIEIGKCSAL